jgi:competence protein ComEA
MTIAKGLIEAAAKLAAKVRGSRWAALGGKAAAYLTGFMLLALVGSGHLSTWLSPPARMVVAIPTAAAATLPPAVSAAPTTAPAAPPEAGADAGTGAEEADAGGPAGVAADGKVILNLATEEDLRRLPGIGKTRAQAILALRARMKKFTRVEDLLKVKGLGRRSLARLRPLVRVD